MAPSTRQARSPSPPPLHRRVLYPNPKGPLPPRILHSRSSATLDPVLLDLIALICREHILPWYSNLSRDPDKLFIQHVTSILVHVIQALEVRIVSVDLVGLLVVDLPLLLERHISDFDQANERARTGLAHNLERDNVFHLLQPHIAVSLVASPTSSSSNASAPRVDKLYLRALVDNLLRLLLPAEDYRAETERAIVREIFVNIIFGNLFDRVAQPWFLHLAIIKILEGSDLKRRTKEQRKRERSGSRNGVVATEESISMANHSPPPRPSTSLSFVFDRIGATVASIPVLVRAVYTSLLTLYLTALASPVPPSYATQPPLTLPFLTFLLTFLPPSLLLSQTIHYIKLPFFVFSSFITSLIFYLTNEKVLTVGLVKDVLEVATRALFPNGHPPPKVPEPDKEEQERLQSRCEEMVAEALPPLLVKFLLSSGGTERPLILSKHLLRALDSHVANVHLFLLIVDLVVGKLFPELLLGAEDL